MENYGKMINAFADVNPDIHTHVVAWGDGKTIIAIGKRSRKKETIPELGDRPTAILVNHGSFNPIHLGHLQIMTDAKKTQ